MRYFVFSRYKLGKVHSHVIKSRDGLNILVYLTLPADIEVNSPAILYHKHHNCLTPCIVEVGKICLRRSTNSEETDLLV